MIKDLVVVRFVNDMCAPLILAFAVPLVCFGCVVGWEQRLQIGEVLCESPVSGDVTASGLKSLGFEFEDAAEFPV